MNTSNRLKNALLIFGLPILFGQLILGNPAELQKRSGCNADNCLRELQGSRSLASPYCSSYLGSAPVTTTTVTVTATVLPYTDSPITPFPKKRSLGSYTAIDSSITAPPLPLITQGVVKRQTTSFYPSKCTENPTAISSGCSCFLKTTSTVTDTATVTALLPSPCDASNNYGLISNGFGYAFDGDQVHGYYFGENTRGACCGRCYGTPNCIAFSEFDLLVNGQPGTFAGVGCDIFLILAATATATQNPTCPLGSLTISLNPTATTASATYYDGVGPCGIPTVVPGNIERRRF